MLSMRRLGTQTQRMPSQQPRYRLYLEVDLRILILVDDYYPSAKSCAKMIHDLAVELSRSHQVTVVTPSDQVVGRARITVEEGIRILRVKASNLKNVNRPMRAWRECRLSSLIWRRAQDFFRANPHDLVIFY